MSATAGNLAGILRSAGLTVNLDYLGEGEHDGQFNPVGLILHHDAAGLSYTDGWNGSDVVAVPRNMSQPGNNGAQFWVGRSGTWYILSAGRKWHAGIGDGYGHIPANSGNIYAYGIETDYGPVRQGWSGPTVTSEGLTWPQWDAAHLAAINVGSRALARALGLNTFCGHKEYAPTRKIDPANLSLNDWRDYITKTQPPPDPGDDDVTDDDIKKIAEAVWAKAISYAKQTNDPKDPEDNVTEPAYKVLSAAASYSGRAAKKK